MKEFLLFALKNVSVTKLYHLKGVIECDCETIFPSFEILYPFLHNSNPSLGNVPTTR